jgi:hypothetical protein
MNQFTVLVLILVVFCYCGGKYCPSVLKKNKEILLGVVGGLVLASFFGFKLEAFEADKYVEAGCCDQNRRNEADCMRMWAEGHDISDLKNMNREIDEKCQG